MSLPRRSSRRKPSLPIMGHGCALGRCAAVARQGNVVAAMPIWLQRENNAMLADTSADALKKLLTPSDRLTIDDEGTLTIDGCSATALLDTYGSPLFVTSEMTIRKNYRRIRDAFRANWPAPVNVMYAIKANNNPAIRAILHEEGAGGDCFGVAEVYATFLGGADPKKVVMNGSTKTDEEIRTAVQKGLYINIDDEEEVDAISRIAAELSSEALVNLRVKIAPSALKDVGSDYMGVASGLQDFLKKKKWGYAPDKARELIERIVETPGLRLEGISSHTGRFTQDPQAFSSYTRELGEVVAELHNATGIDFKILDIGGGWPRERDPESASYDLNTNTIEAFARFATSTLIDPIEHAGMAVPELWLEPGRYIVGNAVTLLCRVGAVKRDLGMTWTHIDGSTNLLMRRDTAHSAYHILAATKMDRPLTNRTRIVGPTCVASLFAEDWPVPDMQRGEPVAILDAGMYAEAASTQFNGVPRPATVLVKDGQAEVIKERETVEDVFAKCRMPARLRHRDAGKRIDAAE